MVNGHIQLFMPFMCFFSYAKWTWRLLLEDLEGWKEGIRLLRLLLLRGPRFPRRQCRNTVEILLWLTLVARLTRLVQAEPLDNDKKKSDTEDQNASKYVIGLKAWELAVRSKASCQLPRNRWFESAKGRWGWDAWRHPVIRATRRPTQPRRRPKMLPCDVTTKLKV